MRHRFTRFALAAAAVALLGVSPSFAQDDPAPEDPKPDEPAAEETVEPPKERKLDEQAGKLLDAWGKAMHLPVHGTADHISAHAGAEGSVFGAGGLGVKIDWTRERGLELNVTASEEMKQQLPPEMQDGLKSVFSTWGREALAPIFETPSIYAQDYDVTLATQEDVNYVELRPFTERVTTEIQRLWFADSGVCDRRTMILRVDPSDPMLAMFVGAEIESTYGYEKIGERHVLTQMSMLTPMGDLQVTYEYAEVTGGPPLLRSMSMITPFAPDPIEVTFRDYTRDGELLETEKKDGEGEAGEGSEDDGDDM